MKWYPLFALLSVSTFLFSACSKDKDKKKDNKIDLSLQRIIVLAGLDATITINGTASAYKVSSDNEQVAKATVQNNKVILITTNAIGKTLIHVTDEANRSNVIEVESSGMTGVWRQIGLNGQAVIETDIQSDDAAFNETLKQALQDTATNLGKSTFTISFSGDTTATFQEGKGTTVIRKGTYTFGNLQLVLKVNGAEEVYLLKNFGSGAVIMNRDYTDYFKNLYPGKGIKKVVLGLVLARVVFYG